MNKAYIILLITLIMVATVSAQNEYEPGVILVKLRNPDVVLLAGNRVINGSAKFQTAMDQYGAIDSYMLPYAGPNAYGWYHIDFSKDAPLKSIRDALKRCSEIECATLNAYGHLSEEPNDTYWDDQWALEKIRMEQTWGYVKPDNTILVGIIDSGLDKNHDDLSDNIWTNPDEIPSNGQDDDNNGKVDDTWGWDFVGGNGSQEDNNPMEDPSDSQNDYHGTRVAGVIAARTYNATGVAGIAGGWQGQTGIRLIGLRVAYRKDTGDGELTQHDAGEAIEYLTELRERGYTVIANMSFQFDKDDDLDYGYFKDAVIDAKNEGVIMVAAAGNKFDKGDYQDAANPNLPAPARWTGVLAIGASTDGATLDDEERSLYSLYDTQTNKLLCVATVDGSSFDLYTTYKYDGYVNNFDGTSAACPIVTGIVALLLTGDDTMTYSEIEDVFKNTSKKINSDEYTYTGNPSRADEVGWGRVDAYDALTYAFPPVSVQITGPTQLQPAQAGTFTANPSDGFSPYTNYRWWKRNDEGMMMGQGKDDDILAPPPGVWIELTQYEGDQEIQVSSTYDFSLKCRVYDNQGHTDEDIHSVDVGYFRKALPFAEQTQQTLETFFVGQNFPNPFNPTTTIRYALAENARVFLAVYDIKGREIERLVDSEQTAGYKSATWDASLYGSGVYFYRMVITNNGKALLNKTVKMLVVK